MILADTMAIFLVIVGLLLAFNGVWLLSRALWGPLVAHAIDAHHEGMIKSFLLGLPMTAVAVVVSGAMMNNKQGLWGLGGLVLFSLYFLFANVGVAGMAAMIGEKLGSKNGEPPWKETVRGGSVLTLAFLFPLAGWIVLLPVALVTGCGANIRAIVREWKVGRERRHQPATVPTETKLEPAARAGDETVEGSPPARD